MSAIQKDIVSWKKLLDMGEYQVLANLKGIQSANRQQGIAIINRLSQNAHWLQTFARSFLRQDRISNQDMDIFNAVVQIKDIKDLSKKISGLSDAGRQLFESFILRPETLWKLMENNKANILSSMISSAKGSLDLSVPDNIAYIQHLEELWKKTRTSKGKIKEELLEEKGRQGLTQGRSFTEDLETPGKHFTEDLETLGKTLGGGLYDSKDKSRLEHLGGEIIE